MAATAQATRKAAIRTTMTPRSDASLAESVKLERAREMLRELRADAEALLAKAERRLARLS